MRTFFYILGWSLIGAVLRFTNLGFKPPWSDEWATLVFSLGHSFRTVPLDQVISLDTLLQPLQLDSTTDAQDVVQHLMKESTHPPFYFVLTYFWLQLLDGGTLVSVWLGRALSASLGVASIPAMFGLGWLLSRSLVVGQMAAALMAVSPYGVYLSQEARHYTLAILWVIASLACLLFVVSKIKQKTAPPFGIILVWIVVNSLGVATHYFFGLTLVAETVVLFSFWLREIQLGKNRIFARYWLRVYLAILGTLIGCAGWIVPWQNIRGNQLTSWVYDGNPLVEFYEPLQRLLVWMLTMLMLLPVEGVPSWVSILSGIVALSVLVWLIPSWWRGWQAVRKLETTQLGVLVLSRFWLSAIAIILAITYIFGADLTLSARFQFVYYPATLLLLAASLGYIWQDSAPKSHSSSRGKKVVTIALLMGILGALTVINNFAYQKVERPDLVVPDMVEAYDPVAPQTPVVIATLHKTHGQTGEMMSLAWQFQQLLAQKQLGFKPQFLLVHQDSDKEQKANQILIQALATISRPFQLWLVNFTAPTELGTLNCTTEDESKRKATGYRYLLYRCGM